LGRAAAGIAGSDVGAERERGDVPGADDNGSGTTTDLVEMAVVAGGVETLTVQNTTLDDVFVHYTGRQLRDELVKALCVPDAAEAGVAAMNRMMAIIEREMRKFFRSPTLMMVSMVMPLVQLIVLGNAFGGKIRDAKMGMVDEDHGTQAIRIKEAFDAVRANMRTFVTIPYDNEVQAREDVRNGKIQGAVIIPPQYSKMVYEKNHPRIALIVDNSDNFMSSTLEDEMTSLTNALNQPDVSPRLLQQTALEVVELYPYIEYMKFCCRARSRWRCSCR
jgi:hypothetical protein